MVYLSSTDGNLLGNMGTGTFALQKTSESEQTQILVFLTYVGTSLANI